MDTAQVIEVLDAEISRLQHVRGLLVGAQPITAIRATKRTMSPEGRKRIAEGQRKRWAKQRKAA